MEKLLTIVIGIVAGVLAIAWGGARVRNKQLRNQKAALLRKEQAKKIADVLMGNKSTADKIARAAKDKAFEIHRERTGRELTKEDVEKFLGRGKQNGD